MDSDAQHRIISFNPNRVGGEMSSFRRAEAVEMLSAADVESVVHDRGRGGHALVELPLCRDLRRIAVSFYHGDHALAQRDEINVSRGGNGRGVIAAGRSEPLAFVKWLSRLGVERR